MKSQPDITWYRRRAQLWKSAARRCRRLWLQSGVAFDSMSKVILGEQAAHSRSKGLVVRFDRRIAKLQEMVGAARRAEDESSSQVEQLKVRVTYLSQAFEASEAAARALRRELDEARTQLTGTRMGFVPGNTVALTATEMNEIDEARSLSQPGGWEQSSTPLEDMRKAIKEVWESHPVSPALMSKQQLCVMRDLMGVPVMLTTAQANELMSNDSDD